jgi:hypothetical protein
MAKNSLTQTTANAELTAFLSEVSTIIAEARKNVYRAVNVAMVPAYRHIGEAIVKHELQGKERADYGEKTIAELAKRLTAKFGKDFNLSNIRYMRRFYETFPISHALRDQLSWTHYRLLLKVKTDEARSFTDEVLQLLSEREQFEVEKRLAE